MKKISVFLFLGITAASYAAIDNDTYLQDLKTKMNANNTIGFTNLAAAKADQEYSYLIIRPLSNVVQVELDGKCTWSTQYNQPICASVSNTFQVNCTESNNTFALSFNAFNGNGQITVTDTTNNQGDIKIQYGSLIDYPDPYSSCSDTTTDSKYCRY
jgi:hypothetical protein